MTPRGLILRPSALLLQPLGKSLLFAISSVSGSALGTVFTYAAMADGTAAQPSLAHRRPMDRAKDYTSRERVVWPVALGFFDQVEILAAWCELRGAFRHFRLDRIGALSVLDENIPRSGAGLLAEYRKIEPKANV